MFCSWITHHVPNWQDCIVVSPDEGGAKRSVMIANDLGLEFAMIHNRLLSKLCIGFFNVLKKTLKTVIDKFVFLFADIRNL